MVTTVGEMIRRDDELAVYQKEADQLIVDIDTLELEAEEKKSELLALGEYCANLSTRIRDMENRLRHLEKLMDKL